MTSLNFEVNGVEYPLIAPSEMTMGEAREAKRLSGGMGLTVIEEGFAAGDPDAWTAIMLVSIRRVDPAAQDAIVDDVTPGELVKAMQAAVEAAQAEADAVPPPSTPAGPLDPAPLNGAMTPVRAGT